MGPLLALLTPSILGHIHQLTYPKHEMYCSYSKPFYGSLTCTRAPQPDGPCDL